MQLTTTAIKHKRYSTYGWNLKEKGAYKNTLSQGEIGVLLGTKVSEVINGEEIIRFDPVEIANSGKILNCILEVRIGTEDNQYFFNGLLIGKNEDVDYSITQLPSLPSWGNPNKLYIVGNIAYIWDVEVMQFKELAGSNSLDKSNYYTKEEIDNLINFEMIDGGNCINQPSYQ